MSQNQIYYNEEYAPISDDYLAAEVRSVVPKKKEPPSSKYKKVKRKKRKSRYDEDMYALPDMTGDNSLTQECQKAPVKNDQCCQRKYVVILSVLAAMIMTGGGVFVGVQYLPGKCSVWNFSILHNI